MITYRDMSFCIPMKPDHPLCNTCSRVLTEEVKAGAISAGLPVAQFMQAPSPEGDCKLHRQKRM